MEKSAKIQMKERKLVDVSFFFLSFATTQNIEYTQLPFEATVRAVYVYVCVLVYSLGEGNGEFAFSPIV